MQEYIPSSIMKSLEEKHPAQFPFQNKDQIEVVCKKKETICIRPMIRSRKNVVVVSPEGIYMQGNYNTIHLTRKPPILRKWKTEENLLDDIFPKNEGWQELFLEWTNIVEIREELTHEKSWNMVVGMFRWPILHITDTVTQNKEIRETLRKKKPSWELILLPRIKMKPILLDLSVFPAKRKRDVNILFLLSYLIHYYWLSSKDQ
ncbi:MAG: hypothetical protein RBG13Loki_1933 [Promethearchaeota archaeon CR_4]|nr:MAG: hypothetical protein RBG13Loki_1933 [Candidatus Lokiarchaeota archaeon CR_4]